MKRIFLDPGHGMDNVKPGVYDPGAVAPPSGIEEADIALAWALTGKAMLLMAGHEVILSRKTEWSKSPLNARVKMAEVNDCDLYLSLHMNAGPSIANGCEAYYRKPEDRNPAYEAVRSLEEIGFKNRGIKTEDQSARKKLAVLDFHKPVTLIEIGFITNLSDLLRAQSRENRIAFWQKFIGRMASIGSL